MTFHVEHGMLLKEAMNAESFLVDEEAVKKFETYRCLILEWNRKISLISKTDESRIVFRHFLQSIGLLKVVHFPDGVRLLDLGSGPGFPGIPLKIMRPDIDLVLAESVKKKARFLDEAVRVLGLTNVEVVADRIDGKKNMRDPVDMVVVRAVASLMDLVRWTFPSLKRNGKIVAIKGSDAEKEAALLQKTAGKQGISISSVTAVPYNPFPGSFVLTSSAVIIINK
jgi:16S rRNA (guanine527-N7)-methyltransferase